MLIRCCCSALASFSDLDFKETKNHLDLVFPFPSSTADEYEFDVDWDSNNLTRKAQQIFMASISMLHSGDHPPGLEDMSVDTQSYYFMYSINNLMLLKLLLFS